MMSDSILSVVTQVRPNDDEFDLSHLKVNLDAQLRNSLKNFTYEKEISNELIEQYKLMIKKNKKISDNLQ